MSLHPLAGQPAPPDSLIDIAAHRRAFHELRPDPENPAQRVAFGTSGHRGRALEASFNEDHVVAIVQAICELRAREGVRGPLFLGMDSHALSGPAQAVALEVLAANEVETRLQPDGGFVPTPAISLAILEWKRDRGTDADGIIITPSHNPPEDGGIKYNPPHGGPADGRITRGIARRANALLSTKLEGVARWSSARAPRNTCARTIMSSSTSRRSRASSERRPWPTPVCGLGSTPWAGLRWPTGRASPNAMVSNSWS